jgi:hypothetical protein
VSDTFDAIMAGYQSVEAAQKDFDGLVQLVKDKKVRTEGVILVEHDADGQVRSTRPATTSAARDWAGAAASAWWWACSRRRCWARSWSAPPPAASSASS